MAAIFPTLAVALLAFSLWSGSHFWRTIAVSWLATVSVGIYLYLDIEEVLLVERIWGYTLFVTVLLWSLLLTPVQLLFHKAEDRKPSSSIWISWDPARSGKKRSEIQADVVAVHGLGSTTAYAWKHSSSGQNWIKDFLPIDFPQCRVIFVNHESRWDAYSPVQSLRDYGQVILDSVASVRRDAEEKSRPLIFVGHSFGGILMKKALVIGKEANPGTDQRLVADSTDGAIFFGTPHKGSNFALFGTLLSYFSYWRGSRTDLLEFLTPSSKELEDLQSSFLRAFSHLYICNFFETKPLFLLNIPLYLVVSKDSATIDGRQSIPIEATHRGLNKFESVEDENYVRVRREIQNTLDHIKKKKIEEHVRHEFAVPFRIRGIPVIGTFVGRQDIIDRMEDCLLSGSEQRLRVLALQGLGGIGKSQLAIEYATRHQMHYTAIFWCSGRSKGTLRNDIASIAEQIPLPSILDTFGKIGKEESDIDNALSAVFEWFSRLENTLWLLIIDNCDHQRSSTSKEAPSDPQTYDIRAFFPNIHQGTIIITTRLSYMRQLGKGIDVGVVSEQEGLQILCNASGREKDEPAAKALVESLNGLPLALNQAGSFIGECSISTKKYLEMYESRASAILAQQPQFSSYDNGSIMTTWELSMDAVSKKNPKAALLLQLWGFLDNCDLAYDHLKAALEAKNTLAVEGSPLPSPALETEANDTENGFQSVSVSKGEAEGWVNRLAEDELLFSNCIAKLREFSLIQPKLDTDAFVIHPVVHEWTRQRLSQADWNEYLAAASVILGRATPLAHWPKAWLITRRLRPHADHVKILLASTKEPLPEAAIGFHGLAILYFDSGLYAQASPFYERAAKGFAELLGPEHEKTVQAWHDRGLPFRELGQYEECRKLWKWTMQTSTRVQGPEHMTSLRATDDLGRLAMLEGDLDSAETFLKLAFQRKTEALGKEHIITVDTERQLAIVACRAGRLETAKKLGQHVLAVWERELGADHTWTMLAIADLGAVHLAEGHAEESEVFFNRAVSGMEAALGPNHQHTLQARLGLGRCFAAMGRLDDAETELVQATEGLKNARGVEHPQTKEAMGQLRELLERKKS